MSKGHSFGAAITVSGNALVVFGHSSGVSEVPGCIGTGICQVGNIIGPWPGTLATFMAFQTTPSGGSYFVLIGFNLADAQANANFIIPAPPSNGIYSFGGTFTFTGTDNSGIPQGVSIPVNTNASYIFDPVSGWAIISVIAAPPTHP